MRIIRSKCKTSNPENSISVQHLKDLIEICGIYLYKIINHSLMHSHFDDGIKLADITPVHKKDDVTNKSNYRPISVLPSGSKLLKELFRTKLLFILKHI